MVGYDCPWKISIDAKAGIDHYINYQVMCRPMRILMRTGDFHQA
jgi:hypothetical protein